MTDENKELLYKALCAYLPYGLYLQYYLADGKKDENLGKMEHYNIRSCINLPKLYKPIIYPLSHLTKKIEHNGELISPSVYCIENFGGFYIQSFIDQWKNYGIKEARMNAQYQVIEKLIEWHFNVFGLPEELYIDKSTL